MTKKEIAIAFLELVGKGVVKAAYERFVSKSFIHHNQYFEGSRAGLLKAMEDAENTHPNTALEVKHCYEDGDTVITHTLVVKADMELVVIHIFKFHDSKITELWDVGQVIDPNSPNQYGLF
ncbi:nuclear transport factor 2 family protein [Formosa sp. S-31]|uniref:nuclear transport factor 2 family protein n=1 Tax=Formosa sp. S-31 TaxID=2790949 RepID=UPI003EBFF9FF